MTTTEILRNARSKLKAKVRYGLREKLKAERKALGLKAQKRKGGKRGNAKRSIKESQAEPQAVADSQPQA